MILAFDTGYFGDSAKTVCFGFDDFTDDEPHAVYTDLTSHVTDYEPGAFYKRELPCIVRLMETHHLMDIDAIIIDGYVVLDDNGTIGLGGHLFEHLGRKVPVIGVAKTEFGRVQKNRREVYRGRSRKPLFITALGINLDEAAEKITSMKGSHRVPALLKKLDSMTKAR